MTDEGDRDQLGDDDEPASDDPRELGRLSVNPHPGHCRVCDVAVIPRTRQYCDDHKSAKGRRGRKVRAMPTNTNTTAAKQMLLDEAGEITTDLQTGIIQQLAPWAPIVGGNWSNRAEANTRATLVIASKHPKILAGILAAAEAEAWVALSTFAVSTIVAVGIEVGMIAGDGRMARGFDLDEIYEEVLRQDAAVGAQVATNYDAGANPFGDGDPGGLMGEIG